MPNLSRRSSGLKPPELDLDVKNIVDYINAEEYIEFTVDTAGTEVTIPHKLEYIPRYFNQAGSETANGQGVIYSGSTAWTNTNVYLTATVAGTYAIILRR